MIQSLTSLLEDAIAARESLFDEGHQTALRLFNGFVEGCPDLVIDLYGATAVIQIHTRVDAPATDYRAVACAAIHKQLPWVKSGIIKSRNSPMREERLGTLAFGDTLDTQIREGSLLYALDLRLHQDCSFYLDTRNVRRWAVENLAGGTVLNAFAYTGSLGVAALGGSAQRVVQVDRTQRFLDVGRASYRLNHFPIRRADFVRADFFREAARLRREAKTFDCIFLDPPFFASGPAGNVDQEGSSERLINKVRPLVSGGGHLIAINNALYLSGKDYLSSLEGLASDGYLEIQDVLPVPDDFVGMLKAPGAKPITDPAPFNHSTKIAILRVGAQGGEIEKPDNSRPTAVY